MSLPASKRSTKIRALDKNLFARYVEVFEPGPGGVVSGESAIPLGRDCGAEETKTLMGIGSFPLQNPLIQQYNCASFGAARLAKTKA